MPKKLILLADDEAHITQVMARAVTNAGFDVIAAEDGEQAYELAEERRPSLIVTDLQMPYMSGIELATKLMSHNELRTIPVILLSARGYVVADETERLDNIKRVFEKPFSAKNVIEHIVEIVRASEHDREAA